MKALPMKERNISVSRSSERSGMYIRQSECTKCNRQLVEQEQLLAAKEDEGKTNTIEEEQGQYPKQQSFIKGVSSSLCLMKCNKMIRRKLSGSLLKILNMLPLYVMLAIIVCELITNYCSSIFNIEITMRGTVYLEFTKIQSYLSIFQLLKQDKQQELNPQSSPAHQDNALYHLNDSYYYIQVAKLFLCIFAILSSKTDKDIPYYFRSQNYEFASQQGSWNKRKLSVNEAMPRESINQIRKSSDSDNKSNIAVKGITHTDEDGGTANNTMKNIIDSSDRPQNSQKESEPIQLMNLRLPMRRDLSDSQTNLSSQHTLQIPGNRKHTSFKGSPLGHSRQKSSSTQIKPCFIPSLTQTQAFQFRAFREQLFLQQNNDSVKSSDPNLNRMNIQPQLSPYSKFNRQKQQKFFPPNGVMAEKRQADVAAQMALSSEIDKQSHSDCSVSREGSNNKLIDSMQITIQSLDAGNGVPATQYNQPLGKLDSGKSLFFHNHARMATHNQPMGSVSSHQIPFNLTRQLVAPKTTNSGGYFSSETGNIPNALSNLTGPTPIDRSLGKKHEAYKTQQQLISKTNSKMNNSQVYSGGATIDQFRKKIKKLETQLNNTKIFLNMVIHDMRNPTNSIEHAIKEVIKVINSAQQDQLQKCLPQSPNFQSLQRSNYQENNSIVAGNSLRNQGNVMVSPSSREVSNKNLNIRFVSQGTDSPKNTLNTQQIISFQQKNSFPKPQSVVSQSLFKNGHQLEQVLEEDIFQDSHEEQKLEDDILLQSVRSSIHDIKEIIPSAINQIAPKNGLTQVGVLPAAIVGGSQLRRSYTILNRQSALERSQQASLNVSQAQPNEDDRSLSGSNINNNDQYLSRAESIQEDLPQERDLVQSSILHQVHVLKIKPSQMDQGIPKNTQSRVVRRIFIEEVSDQLFETQMNKQQTNNVDIQHSASNVGGPPNLLMNFESMENIEMRQSRPQNERAANPISTLNIINHPQFRTNITEEVKNTTEIRNASHSDMGVTNRNHLTQSVAVGNRVVSGANMQITNTSDERRNHLGPQATNSAQSVIRNRSLENQYSITGQTNSNTLHTMINRLNSKNQEEEKKDPQTQSSQGNMLKINSSKREISSNRKDCVSTNQLHNLDQKQIVAFQNIKQYSMQKSDELQIPQQNCNNVALPQFFSPGTPSIGQRSAGFNMIQRPSMSGLSYLNVLNAQLKGVILSQEEKKQCESLLKNSLFSSTMLLNLINDLLDLAKIENQAFNLHTTDFNLHEVIQKALDTLEFSAQQKTIDMQYIYEEEHVGYFMAIAGDDNRYLQILLNFLSNALKFTPAHGTIKVEVRLIDTQTKSNKDPQEDDQKKLKLQRQKTVRAAKDLGDLKVKRCRSNEQLEKKDFVRKTTIIDGTKFTNSGLKDNSHQSRGPNHQIDGDQLKLDIQNALKKTNQPVEKYIKFELRIQDSGYGISPENQKKLFMNFSRLEEHAGENKTGTGLGLSICKSLIELMGGSVSVESELGKGTCFIMQLQTQCKYPSAQAIKQWLDQKKGVESSTVREKSSNGLKKGFQINIEELKSNQGSSQASHQKLSPLYKYSCEVQNQSSFFNYQNLLPAQQQQPDKTLQLPMSRSKQRLQKTQQRNNQNLIPSISIQQDGQDQIFINPQNQQAIISFKDGVYNTGNFYLGPQQIVCNDDGKHQMIMQHNLYPFMMNSAQQAPIYFSGNMMNDDDLGAQNLDCLDPITVNNFLNFQQVQISQANPPSQQFRALIANDDSFQLQIVGMIMKRCGFLVDEAENGLVALQKYHSAKVPYDVVVLDLDMPIMNGFDTCSRLRKSGAKESIRELLGFGSTPKNKRLTQHGFGGTIVDNAYIHDEDSFQERILIVALSGLITESVIEKGTKCGFDEFIEAPITEAKVKEIILTRLQNREFLMCREPCDDEEQLVEDSENQSRLSRLQQQYKNSSTLNPNSRRLSSRAALMPKGTILQNQAFSAVDEEQSNAQEGENEDTFSINRSVIGPRSSLHQERPFISNQMMSGVNGNSGMIQYSSK